MKTIQTDAQARAEFDDYASSYAELLDDPARNRFAKDPLHFHRRKWLLIQKLLNRAGVNVATQRWLDVGCGRGELLELGGSSFAHAIGCDPSARMLSSQASIEMRKQPSPIELPFADGSVDFVTAVCVFHHVHGEAMTRLTNEIRRVLTPGGMCCVVEHNPWNPVTRRIVKRCPVDVDAELLNATAARTLLQASGLELVSTDYFLYFPESLFTRFSLLESLLHKLPLGGQYALLARLPLQRGRRVRSGKAGPRVSRENLVPDTAAD